MALNREQKRQLERSGKLGDADGDGDGGSGNGNGNGGGRGPSGSGGGADDDGGRKGRATPARGADAKEERTSARQFVREVRSELRKVAWPTRSETLNYSVIVALTLVFMTTLIFCLDWLFGEVVLRIFQAR